MTQTLIKVDRSTHLLYPDSVKKIGILSLNLSDRQSMTLQRFSSIYTKSRRVGVGSQDTLSMDTSRGVISSKTVLVSMMH